MNSSRELRALAAIDIPPLYGVRFLAALSVAVAHGVVVTRLGEFRAGSYLISGAGFGMTLFFVLSGFLIHYHHSDDVRQGKAGIIDFAWARFARLYPLYVSFLAIDYLLGLEIVRYFAKSDNRLIEQLNSLPYFATLTQSWVYSPGQEYSLIYQMGPAVSVAWSISTEAFFYLIYPLIAFAIFRLPAKSTLWIAAAFCICWVLIWCAVAISIPALNTFAVARWGPIADISHRQDSFVRWLRYFSPYARVGEFVLGCLTAQFYMQIRDLPISKREAQVGLLALSVSTISILGIIWLYRHTALLNAIRDNFGLAPSIAILVFSLARYKSALASCLSTPPMIILGKSSYSFYLLHMLTLSGVAILTVFQFPDRQTGTLVLILRIFAWLALTAILSICLYKGLEVPAMRWLKDRRLHRPNLVTESTK